MTFLFFQILLFYLDNSRTVHSTTPTQSLIQSVKEKMKADWGKT